MNPRTSPLANSAGAAAPASAQAGSGLSIFEGDEQGGTGPPKATAGGIGGKPPGQIGGSLVGAAGGDGDDSDASGSSLELVLETDGTGNGDSAADTLAVAAVVDSGATAIGDDEQALPPGLFETEAEAPAPLAVIGATEEVPVRFRGWNLAACVAMLISIGSLGAAGFQVISKLAM